MCHYAVFSFWLLKGERISTLKMPYFYPNLAKFPQRMGEVLQIHKKKGGADRGSDFNHIVIRRYPE
jgi:hypothetical protein